MAANSQFEGHTEIYVQELNLTQMQLVGEPVVIWDGAVRGAVWSEAPHIYKVNGVYYLLTAEGGTAHHHAVVVARSDAITGPYEGNRGNPILTHRHLGLDYPIVGTGHADLVQTQRGDWWMVLLAMRPYGGYYYNLGRETFLVAGALGGWLAHCQPRNRPRGNHLSGARSTGTHLAYTPYP